MQQIIDNSTLLEVGELLIGIQTFNKDNRESVERKIENLLILVHALLIDDKIKHSSLKIDRNNLGVKYLLEEAPTQNIIEPLIWDWNAENKLLSSVRKKISSEINNGVLAPVMKNINNKVNLVQLVSDEISTYLLPEGLGHYWNNIGFENGESREAKELYLSFKNLYSYTLIKQDNRKKSIHEEIIDYINKVVKNQSKAKVISEWYWLSFLSNVIRAEYYINLARINKAVYSPLATRRLLIEELIKGDPKEDIYILRNDDRNESIFLSLLYVLEKSNWQREDFIKTILTLKNDKNSPLFSLSKLLARVSKLDRNLTSTLQEEIIIKKEFKAFENLVHSKINKKEGLIKDSSLTERLPKEFFKNWLKN